MGKSYGKTGLSCDRLAVPENGRYGGCFESGRLWRDNPEKDRADTGCLFFRHKIKMDSGSCGRSEGTGPKGRASVRNRGYLADLESDE